MDGTRSWDEGGKTFLGSNRSAFWKEVRSGSPGSRDDEISRDDDEED